VRIEGEKFRAAMEGAPLDDARHQGSHRWGGGGGGCLGTLLRKEEKKTGKVIRRRVPRKPRHRKATERTQSKPRLRRAYLQGRLYLVLKSMRPDDPLFIPMCTGRQRNFRLPSTKGYPGLTIGGKKTRGIKRSSRKKQRGSKREVSRGHQRVGTLICSTPPPKPPPPPTPTATPQKKKSSCEQSTAKHFCIGGLCSSQTKSSLGEHIMERI